MQDLHCTCICQSFSSNHALDSSVSY
jgi:hypothetical protein